MNNYPKILLLRGTEERNLRYMQEAIPLGESTIRGALENAGWMHKRLTT